MYIRSVTSLFLGGKLKKLLTVQAIAPMDAAPGANARLMEK